MALCLGQKTLCLGQGALWDIEKYRTELQQCDFTGHMMEIERHVCNVLPVYCLSIGNFISKRV